MHEPVHLSRFRLSTTLSRQRLALLFWFLALRLVLDVGYVSFVHPNYEYAGFSLDSDPGRAAFSYLLVLIVGAIVPARLVRTSDVFVTYLGAAVILPLTTLFALASTSVPPLVMSLIALFIVARTAQTKSLREPLPIIGSRRIVPVAVAILLAAIASNMVVRGGLAGFNLDLRDVYLFRESQASITNTGLLAYVNTWASKVFAPALLAIALATHRWLLVGVSLGLFLFLFGVTAHKSTLFVPVMVIGIWIVFRRMRSLWMIPAGLSIVVSGSVAYSLVSHDFLPASLFVRRLFFVPADLHNQYFVFFSSNPHVLWSNSILERFVPYPYTTSVPDLIGQWVGSGAYANTGFIAMGFAHAGYVGVTLYSVLLGLILALINRIGKRYRAPWLPVAITLTSLRSVAGTDLFTTLLTHGLIVSIAILYLAGSRDRGLRTRPVAAPR